MVIAVLLNSDYNRDDEREYFPNVMEALNTSWLLLLTFLNLTPERGGASDSWVTQMEMTSILTIGLFL